MSYETLLTEARDGVAVVTVNRSDVRNALNRRVIESVKSTLDRFREDDGVVTLIFTGAGEKAFVAGTHIGELKDRTIVDGLAANMLRLYDEIEGFEKPTIATVNGYAFGGGCELAIACDIRLASENARFAQPEVSLGIPPGWGGTQRLPRLIGPGLAAEMIYTGRQVTAEEAHRIGLVNAVHPLDQLMPAAREMAARIARNSPAAVRASKNLMGLVFTGDQAAGLAAEVV